MLFKEEKLQSLGEVCRKTGNKRGAECLEQNIHVSIQRILRLNCFRIPEEPAIRRLANSPTWGEGCCFALFSGCLETLTVEMWRWRTWVEERHAVRRIFRIWGCWQPSWRSRLWQGGGQADAFLCFDKIWYRMSMQLSSTCDLGTRGWYLAGGSLKLNC